MTGKLAVMVFAVLSTNVQGKCAAGDLDFKEWPQAMQDTINADKGQMKMIANVGCAAAAMLKAQGMDCASDLAAIGGAGSTFCGICAKSCEASDCSKSCPAAAATADPKPTQPATTAKPKPATTKAGAAAKPKPATTKAAKAGATTKAGAKAGATTKAGAGAKAGVTTKAGATTAKAAAKAAIEITGDITLKVADAAAAAKFMKDTAAQGAVTAGIASAHGVEKSAVTAKFKTMAVAATTTTGKRRLDSSERRLAGTMIKVDYTIKVSGAMADKVKKKAEELTKAKLADSVKAEVTNAKIAYAVTVESMTKATIKTAATTKAPLQEVTSHAVTQWLPGVAATALAVLVFSL